MYYKRIKARLRKLRAAIECLEVDDGSEEGRLRRTLSSAVVRGRLSAFDEEER